jgi:hypothetical protein
MPCHACIETKACEPDGHNENIKHFKTSCIMRIAFNEIGISIDLK